MGVVEIEWDRWRVSGSGGGRVGQVERTGTGGE